MRLVDFACALELTGPPAIWASKLLRCYVMTIDYRARTIVMNRHAATQDCLKQLVSP